MGLALKNFVRACFIFGMPGLQLLIQRAHLPDPADQDFKRPMGVTRKGCLGEGLVRQFCQIDDTRVSDLAEFGQMRAKGVRGQGQRSC